MSPFAGFGKLTKLSRNLRMRHFTFNIVLNENKYMKTYEIRHNRQQCGFRFVVIPFKSTCTNYMAFALILRVTECQCNSMLYKSYHINSLINLSQVHQED